MKSRPVLLPVAMSESVALQQLVSMLISVILVTTEGHAEAYCLCLHLRPC